MMMMMRMSYTVAFEKIWEQYPPILFHLVHNVKLIVIVFLAAPLRTQSVGCPSAVATPVKIVHFTHYVTRVHRVPHPVADYVEVPVPHVPGAASSDNIAYICIAPFHVHSIDLKTALNSVNFNRFQLALSHASTTRGAYHTLYERCFCT